MTDLRRYYQILELELGASQSEIKQAYRTLAKLWHPDCFPGNPKKQREAEEQIKQLNEAYDFLKNQVETPPSSSHPASTSSPRKTTYTPRSTEPEVYFNLGVDCASRKNYQAALDAFSMAIRLNPNYLEAYQHRSLVLAKMGFENRAFSDRRRATQLEAERKVAAPRTQSTQAKPSPPQASPPPSSTAPTPTAEPLSWDCIRTLPGPADVVTSLVFAQNSRVLVTDISPALEGRGFMEST
ncbi:MAG: DnaJ domain-containing protein [Elainellaceae cyanobacterium]